MHAAIAPQLAMHQRLCACTVRARCDDGRTGACVALMILLTMCVHVAMAVAPQHAMYQRFCGINARTCYDDGRNAACNESATLRLHCGRMLFTMSTHVAMKTLGFLRSHFFYNLCDRSIIYDTLTIPRVIHHKSTVIFDPSNIVCMSSSRSHWPFAIHGSLRV